ncbi:olfactory receptor 11A1-like [Myripristis murdjan]|uniref:olfactory receptor 11A1-like n=1 Tax=Myripristis murdjan TaxID=586833 RepID=UPI0011761AE1|nr:olfactory receptor 11A1-like [Myripristis murdjan]
MPLLNMSTTVTEFVIGGFDTTQRPVLVGVVMLVVYVLVMVGNVANILFIVCDRQLHKPMFLLICNLAVVDMLYSSSSTPTMIGVLVSEVKTISYVPCLVQMFVFHLAGVMEMFALAVMALDRLIAICYPFRYHSLLTNARTCVLAYVLWIVAAAFVAIMPAIVVPLPYCHSRLKYIFCDFAAVVRATCGNPGYIFRLITIITFFLLFFTFGLICLSYLMIIIAVRSFSKNDKKKTFSTCLSHLIVVTCYYGPVFIRVVLTRAGVVLTLEERHGLMVGAILGPSLVNPFVYCLRTKEIKNKIFKKLQKQEC